MFEKLKQYKDLRDKAKKLRDQLADESVVAESDGVHLVMAGTQEVLRVEINPDLLTLENKKRLETAFCSAVNQAHKKIQQVMVQKMRSSGDLNLPGM